MVSPTKPAIVIVQGNFQLPEVYSKLADTLRASGYLVVHPTFPTLTQTDDPEFTSKSLTDGALSVRAEVKALADKGESILVFMHSYGGMVGNEAVTKDLSFSQRKSNGLPGGVVHLFYLAAPILTEGQSFFDVVGELPGQDVKPDGSYTMKDSAKILYHDLPMHEAREWESKILYQSPAVKTSKMTNEAFRFVPSTYVVCEKDRGHPPDFQTSFGNLAGSEILRIDSGHSPMLSHTTELCHMIDKVARSAVAETVL
ncbi:catalytic protein [Xylariomycetidae sp. FL2044]|nr:catalytic protein [Xylariomycetidae sp. FL2044]